MPSPWRINHLLTAALVAQWLRIEFTGLSFRDGVDRKSQKISFLERAETLDCGFDGEIATITRLNFRK